VAGLLYRQTVQTNTRQYKRNSLVYQKKHSSFHKIRTKPIELVSYAYGNSYPVIIYFDFQIHKSLGSVDSRGFCCCSSRQSAGEELRQQCISTSKTIPNLSVAHCWRPRLLRHIFLGEIQVAYHHNGEAECALSAVSKRKGKTRFYSSFASSFFQATGEEWISQKTATSWSNTIAVEKNVCVNLYVLLKP